MEAQFDETQLLPAPMETPKVLLVEDDELMLEHLTALVESAGFKALTAKNGDQALDSLQHHFTPIVILGRDLPDTDGIALCRIIREREFAGPVYVVLLTVGDSDEDILAGLEAGADDHLSKRASPAQLIARLRIAQKILSLEHSLKDALEERKRIAMTDSLTGAYNRHYFMRHLSRELNRIRRFGGEVSLLLFDIDHFKRINDNHGHAVGDEVLSGFVQRIQEGLPRDTDWCARLGGEEFAVVLPATNLAGANIVAERLRGNIASSPIITSGGRIGVTTSIGISGAKSFSHGAELSAEELLNAADRCLYTSKQTGRNKVTMTKLRVRV